MTDSKLYCPQDCARDGILPHRRQHTFAHFPGVMLRLHICKSPQGQTQIRPTYAHLTVPPPKYPPKAGHLPWSQEHTQAASSSSGPLNPSFPEGEFNTHKKSHCWTQVCSVCPHGDTTRQHRRIHLHCLQPKQQQGQLWERQPQGLALLPLPHKIRYRYHMAMTCSSADKRNLDLWPGDERLGCCDLFSIFHIPTSYLICFANELQVSGHVLNNVI